MNYKEWPFIEANRLLKKIRQENKSHAALESGFGPSGLPHIGTFAEAARTSFVIKALNIIAPEISTTFITFSDDMDGLRALPENIPNHEMISQHLGKPLNHIPDPYGECESFSGNMNNRLKQFLNTFNFEHKFVSSADMYKSGIFNEGLALIMKHHKSIIQIFTSMISEEKRESWSPFFPICHNCGKITTTRVMEHDVNNNEVTYQCSNSTNPIIAPCNYEGKTSIFNSLTKVGWKIDWALRWFALGIDYEMYGKDLIDSFVISEKVIRIMGGKLPITYKYELFLDELGGKISKKLGNGVSLDEWLKYAPTDALLYFMYINPNQPKRMSLALIPKAVDNYLKRSVAYKGETDSPITIIKNKGKVPETVSSIDYLLIINLVRALNVNDPDVIMRYLTRYDPRINEGDNSRFFEALIQKALLYDEEVIKAENREVEIDHGFDDYLRILNSRLNDLRESGNATSEVVQSLCFEVARNNDLITKDWFKFLYQVLLSQESGPRIGSFICLYGIDASSQRIESYLRGEK